MQLAKNIVVKVGVPFLKIYLRDSRFIFNYKKNKYV